MAGDPAACGDTCGFLLAQVYMHIYLCEYQYQVWPWCGPPHPLPVANKGLGTGTPNAKKVMSSWWSLESWEGAISNIYIHTDSPLYSSIYLYRMYIRNDTHSTMCD